MTSTDGALLAAALVAFAVGAIHSILGEMLIFRRMRRGGLVPTHGADLLRERHVRILWASWHCLTVMGWGMAANLAWMALGQQPDATFVLAAVALPMAICAAIVFVATRAAHPGWIGLLAVAALAAGSVVT